MCLSHCAHVEFLEQEFRQTKAGAEREKTATDRERETY